MWKVFSFKHSALCFMLCLIVQNSVDAANIMFLHSYASYSHRVSMFPLANALASRGHNITYVSPISPDRPNPNMLDITPKTFSVFNYESIAKDFNINLRINKQMSILFTVLDSLHTQSCEILLNSQEFKAWIMTSPKIDLIVADFIPDCAVGIAYKLNAKVIIYNTIAFYGKMLEQYKLSDESLATYMDYPFKPSEMTFLDRIQNALIPLVWTYFEQKSANYLETAIKNGLNITNLPPVYDLVRNVSLVLMTGNYISEQPRSLPPMFVSVPGLHIKDNHESLPKELEQFINSPNDDGTDSDGFVYISLGTVVEVINLPKKIQDVFMNSIKAFPKIKFLWRWGGEFTALDKPQNLYMSKWFPQQDVLSHPKIRAFITQAGRPSVQEALSNEVPMIAFPILGDQDFNAMRMEEIGVAVVLEIGEVTVDQLQDALQRVLFDKSFQNNVKKMSTIFKDLPMKPIDTAVWWTEYVLRHDDLSHLKPIARNQTWWQRRMLDVWLFLFLIGITGILCLIFLFVLIFKWVQKYIVVASKIKTS